MFTPIRTLFALLLFLLSASTATAGGPEILTIRFAPPPGMTLRYRATVTRTVAGKVVPGSLEASFRFDGGGDRRTLTVTPLTADVPGQPPLDVGSPSFPVALRPLVAAQIYDIDHDGNLLRMANWATYRESQRTGLSALVAMMAKDEAGRATAARFLQALTARIEAMTAEQASAFNMKTWAPLFGLGGVSLPASSPQTKDVAIDAGIIPTALPAHLTLSLTRSAPGRIHLHDESVIDPDVAAPALAAFFEQMLAKVAADDEAARARVGAMRQQLNGIRITDRVDLEIDEATGLAVSAVIHREATTAGASQPSVQETRIERVG